MCPNCALTLQSEVKSKLAFLDTLSQFFAKESDIIKEIKFITLVSSIEEHRENFSSSRDSKQKPGGIYQGEISLKNIPSFILQMTKEDLYRT